MADNDELSFADEKEIDLKDVIKLQALFRGALVRKWITQTRENYKSILNELENNENLIIQWKNKHPCLPSVKKKPRKVRSQRKEVPNGQETKVTSFATDINPTNAVSTDINSPAPANDKIVIALASKLTTVETQTSFCEVRNENICQTDFLAEQYIPEKDKGSLKKSKEEVGKNEYEGQRAERTSRILPEASKQIEESVIAPTSSFHDNSQRESFNHTDDIEHSLFLSMQNKTLQSTEDTEQSGRSENYDTEKDFNPCVSGMHQKQTDAGTGLTLEKEETQEKMAPLSSVTLKDSSVLTNVSSVWDSFSSNTEALKDTEISSQPKPTDSTQYPKNKESLEELRKNVAMELLWVQQAITSRKNYLRLKSEMRT